MSIIYLILYLIFQATNIEYDEHKGRIAIGRLHAGILKKGMDVKVILSQILNMFYATF